MDWNFFLEVLVGGLLSGVMYSLVAIGFVLIYKTSGVLNFAQGAMVLFAALTFVSLVEGGVPFVAALAVSAAVMVLLGFAIGNTIDLAGTTFTTGTINGGNVLTVTETGGGTISLQLAADQLQQRGFAGAVAADQADAAAGIDHQGRMLQ